MQNNKWLTRYHLRTSTKSTSSGATTQHIASKSFQFYFEENHEQVTRTEVQCFILKWMKQPFLNRKREPKRGGRTCKERALLLELAWDGYELKNQLSRVIWGDPISNVAFFQTLTHKKWNFPLSWCATFERCTPLFGENHIVFFAWEKHSWVF